MPATASLSEESEWKTVPVRRRAARDDAWTSGLWPPPPPPGWIDDGSVPRRLDYIYGTWYTNPSLQSPWSTNWEDWPGLVYYVLHDGKPKVEKMFKQIFDVGTIEPLAYLEGHGASIFFFSAEGRYYLWNDFKLTVHRLNFASPKEFLKHALQNQPHQMPDVVVQTRRPGAQLAWYWSSSAGDIRGTVRSR